MQDSEQKMQHFVTIDQISMGSIPNDTARNTSRLKGQSQDLQLHFPIHHTVRTLLTQFKAALKKVDYKCFYMSEKQLFFIRLSLRDRFRKLFLCKQPPKFILTITTHEFLSLRTVVIKPLKSDSKYAFKESRPNQLYDQLEAMAKMLQGLVSLKQVQVINTDQLDSEYKQDFYSLDATSYYMYSRMLVDGNYSLGQKILAVNDRFNEKSRLQATSKEDLHWLSEALNEISDELLQGFNCSRKELVQILSYCRKSVQQYFHNYHRQVVANERRDYTLDSQGFTLEIKELQKKMPETYRQLCKLQSSFSSMDILKQLYMIGLIFKTECELRELQSQITNRCILLIKTCYSSIISDKAKMLKSSGYSEQDYAEYISKFHLDHEITF